MGKEKFIVPDEIWLRWIRQHFADEADYAKFCWVCDNIIACY